jgi:hypothetical protein
MATVTKSGHEISITFDSGAKVSVDASRHNLSSEQQSALDKAIKGLHKVSDETLLAEGCPAKPHLHATEFERLQGLKASLGSSGATQDLRGPIIDFCLHVWIVGK